MREQSSECNLMPIKGKAVIIIRLNVSAAFHTVDYHVRVPILKNMFGLSFKADK